MNETKTEVRAYEIRAFCECGGEFVHTGRQKLMYPPLNEYECVECKRLLSSTYRYPRMEYEPIAAKEKLCLRCGALDILDEAFLCAYCYKELEEGTRRIQDEKTELMPYWVSWTSEDKFGSFRLESPWWVTQTTDTGKVVCAAVRAVNEQHVIDTITQAYDKVEEKPKIKFRFILERPKDWSPFCSRFEKSDWMKW